MRTITVDKVYIVVEHFPYDGMEIVSVWSTKDRAEAEKDRFISFIGNGRWSNHYFVIESNVDEDGQQAGSQK